MLARLVVSAEPLGEILVEPDRAERRNRRVSVSVKEDEFLVLGEERGEPFRLVGVADPEPRVELLERVVRDLSVLLRPIVVEIEGRIVEVDIFREALGRGP